MSLKTLAASAAGIGFALAMTTTSQANAQSGTIGTLPTTGTCAGTLPCDPPVIGDKPTAPTQTTTVTGTNTNTNTNDNGNYNTNTNTGYGGSGGTATATGGEGGKGGSATGGDAKSTATGGAATVGSLTTGPSTATVGNLTTGPATATVGNLTTGPATATVGNLTTGPATATNGPQTTTVGGQQTTVGGQQTTVGGQQTTVGGQQQSQTNAGNNSSYNNTVKYQAAAYAPGIYSTNPCSLGVSFGVVQATGGLSIPLSQCLKNQGNQNYRTEMLRTGDPDAMAISVTAQSKYDPALADALNANTTLLAGRFGRHAQPQPQPQVDTRVIYIGPGGQSAAPVDPTAFAPPVAAGSSSVLPEGPGRVAAAAPKAPGQ